MKGLKFTAYANWCMYVCMYIYSKDKKRINHGYICYSLYYKTYVRDQDYSNMIIVLR